MKSKLQISKGATLPANSPVLATFEEPQIAGNPFEESVYTTSLESQPQRERSQHKYKKYTKPTQDGTLLLSRCN